MIKKINKMIEGKTVGKKIVTACGQKKLEKENTIKQKSRLVG